MKNLSKVKHDKDKGTSVCVIILPVLVLVRPDIIFIENIIMDVLGHGVKHFREPGMQTAIFKQQQKKNT